MTALCSVYAWVLIHIAPPRTCTPAAHSKVKGNSLERGVHRSTQKAEGISTLCSWAVPVRSPWPLGEACLSALGLGYYSASDENTVTGLKEGKGEFNGVHNWQVQQGPLLLRCGSRSPSAISTVLPHPACLCGPASPWGHSSWWPWAQLREKDSAHPLQLGNLMESCNV